MIFTLTGEINNPSFFPVQLHGINYKIYLDDTFMFEDHINGTLILPNSYVVVNRILNIDRSSLNSRQIETLKSLEIIGKGGTVTIRLEGNFTSTCNSFTRSKSFSMLTKEG